MKLLCEPNVDPSQYIWDHLNDLSERLETWDHVGVYRSEIDAIEHEARDGFIPFTNGGWSGRAYVSFWDGKDNFKCMEGYAAGDRKSMLEEFRAAVNSGRYKALGVLRAGEIKEAPAESKDWSDEEFWEFYNIEPFYDDEKQLEMFSRKEVGWAYIEPLAWHWQQEWEQKDDSTFFLDFRAVFYAADNHRNESGEDEVYFFAGVNTDFDYGRDNVAWFSAYGSSPNCHVQEYSKTVKLSEMTSDMVKSITDEMYEHFSKA